MTPNAVLWKVDRVVLNMFPAIFTTVLFAVTAVCATQAATRLGSFSGNTLRLVLALCILGLWHLGWGTPIVGLEKLQLILAGAIGFGIGGMCMFLAFPLIGSTLSLLVVECAAAVFSITLGWLWLKQSVSGPQLVFALMSISGVIIGLFPRDLPKATLRITLMGLGLTVIASLGQSLSFLISKLAFMELGASGVAVSPMSAAAYRLLGGCIVASVILLVTGARSKKTDASVGEFLNKLKTTWPWVVANALTGPVLGVTFMLWAIREVGNPGLVQSVVATATLLSVPLSRMTEKRYLRRNYYIGAVVSIIGTAGLLTHGLIA